MDFTFLIWTIKQIIISLALGNLGLIGTTTTTGSSYFILHKQKKSFICWKFSVEFLGGLNNEE